MIYEIFFLLTLVFKNNDVKILLLMTFISLSISLKNSNILENKSRFFEISDSQLLYIMTFIIKNLTFK